MLMTQEQTAEIECPVYRIIFAMAMQMTHQGVDYHCYGKGCPFWRWYDPEKRLKSMKRLESTGDFGQVEYYPLENRRGYCGLGGKVINE